MEAADPIVRRRWERQFRTVEEKRLIVEATRRAGVSVAAVAQARGVNANQVFYWRKLYAAGQLECKPLLAENLDTPRVWLLPVTVDAEHPSVWPWVRRSQPEPDAAVLSGVASPADFSDTV